MRILDRYLIRGYLYPLVYCILLFFILFIIIDAFNNLDEFLKKGVSLGVVLSYYLYSLPAILVQITPISALVAVLYILGNLNRQNEIIALKASGVSTAQILSPYLFVGLLISFAIFLFNETVVPKSQLTSTSIMEGLIKKGKKSLSERAIKNVTLYDAENRMIFAREYEILSQTLYDVVILQDDAKQSLTSKLTAKKARYENGRWTLEDTAKYPLNRRGDIDGEPVFSKTLELNLAVRPEDFVKEASQVEFMSAKELMAYRNHFKNQSRKLSQRISVDLHYKIAYPFVSFVVMLIGAPLAMKVKRGSAMLGVGMSLGVVMLYYGIHSICLALGKSGELPPLISAWFSNILFALVGVYLIKTTA